jgi:glycosyltransferase involved in cell wall biosynthesis
VIDELSILIPVYNCTCASLVETLHNQCAAIPSLQWEIIVADDGSTDSSMTERNKEDVCTLPHCNYIIRKENAGRAAIRNYLAKQAQYEWLLFIDGDRIVHQENFIACYLKNANAPVICGGYDINCTNEKDKHNLRYLYEKKNENKRTISKLRKQPYQNFNTTNFIVKRNIMTQYPFDERIRKYGYEDVMFGKTLCREHIAIGHIHNPVTIDEYESNVQFVDKTTEGMQTLCDFRDEIKGYSGIVDAGNSLQRYHLIRFVSFIYRIAGNKIRHNLQSNNPHIFLFNIYKLILYCNLLDKQRHQQ